MLLGCCNSLSISISQLITSNKTIFEIFVSSTLPIHDNNPWWCHLWLTYKVAFTSFFGNAHANSMLLRVNILPIFHSTNFPHWSKFELFTSTNFPSLYLTVYKYAVEEIAFYLLISSKMFRQINFRHIFMEPFVTQCLSHRI